MQSNRRNLLLEALSPETIRSLGIHESRFGNGALLYSTEEHTETVFFPLDGTVVSILRTTEDGSMVESGIIGSEGVVGVQAVIAEPGPAGNEAIVQIEGPIACGELARIRHLFRANAALRDAILAFTSAMIEQVSQNLVCNRLHDIEQRLAKWLLVVRHRAFTNDLHLTQEFLAHMLGVHRPAVSIAIRALERDGAIRHTRNRVEIRDPEALAARACECHAVLHGALLRMRATFARERTADD